jgi:hypothetical protein
MTRLAALVEQYGHQWKKIAPILAAEGYQDQRGKPYSDNYLRKKMKHQESTCSGRHSEPSELSVMDIPALARAVTSLLVDHGLLESAIEDVLERLERTSPGQQHDMPPQPERVTDRRWEKLAGTCDCELVKLFHERRRELRLSVSQMLDYALWNFFGKPRLSYESKASEPSEE